MTQKEEHIAESGSLKDRIMAMPHDSVLFRSVKKDFENREQMFSEILKKKLGDRYLIVLCFCAIRIIFIHACPKIWTFFRKCLFYVCNQLKKVWHSNLTSGMFTQWKKTINERSCIHGCRCQCHRCPWFPIHACTLLHNQIRSNLSKVSSYLIWGYRKDWWRWLFFCLWDACWW